jgi:hypothetical protein
MRQVKRHLIGVPGLCMNLREEQKGRGGGLHTATGIGSLFRHQHLPSVRNRILLCPNKPTYDRVFFFLQSRIKKNYESARSFNGVCKRNPLRDVMQYSETGAMVARCDPAPPLFLSQEHETGTTLSQLLPEQ